MATTTPNLGLGKPEVTDKLVDSLYGFNGNADLLDEIIGKLSDLNTAQKDSLVEAINEAAQGEGMGITGATVGQIAKITAVDDSGKPTAWEAVDMPSGGTDGKTAYQYAQDGGYTGTEAEFAEKLAQEQLVGTTDDLTPTQVYEAVSAGIPVKVQYIDPTFGLSSFTAFNVSESMNVIASNAILNYQNKYLLAALYGDKSINGWLYEVTPLAKPSDIPSALPNPNALTFTGAVTGSYDGSTAKTVNIPSTVTDDHINSLIDTKLGVIENGSY